MSSGLDKSSQSGKDDLCVMGQLQNELEMSSSRGECNGFEVSARNNSVDVSCQPQ